MEENSRFEALDGVEQALLATALDIAIAIWKQDAETAGRCAPRLQAAFERYVIDGTKLREELCV